MGGEFGPPVGGKVNCKEFKINCNTLKKLILKINCKDFKTNFNIVIQIRRNDEMINASKLAKMHNI